MAQATAVVHKGKKRNWWHVDVWLGYNDPQQVQGEPTMTYARPYRPDAAEVEEFMQDTIDNFGE